MSAQPHHHPTSSESASKTQHDAIPHALVESCSRDVVFVRWGVVHLEQARPVSRRAREDTPFEELAAGQAVRDAKRGKHLGAPIYLEAMPPIMVCCDYKRLCQGHTVIVAMAIASCSLSFESRTSTEDPEARPAAAEPEIKHSAGRLAAPGAWAGGDRSWYSAASRLFLRAPTSAAAWRHA